MLEDLRKFFKVYQHYRLSVNEELLREKLKNSSVSSEWKLLGELINQSEELANNPNARRNFFAHLGMENNSVYVKKANDGKFMYEDGM